MDNGRAFVLDSAKSVREAEAITPGGLWIMNYS